MSTYLPYLFLVLLPVVLYLAAVKFVPDRVPEKAPFKGKLTHFFEGRKSSSSKRENPSREKRHRPEGADVPFKERPIYTQSVELWNQVAVRFVWRFLLKRVILKGVIVFFCFGVVLGAFNTLTVFGGFAKKGEWKAVFNWLKYIPGLDRLAPNGEQLMFAPKTRSLFNRGEYVARWPWGFELSDALKLVLFIELFSVIVVRPFFEGMLAFTIEHSVYHIGRLGLIVAVHALFDRYNSRGENIILGLGMFVACAEFSYYLIGYHSYNAEINQYVYLETTAYEAYTLVAVCLLMFAYMFILHPAYVIRKASIPVGRENGRRQGSFVRQQPALQVVTAQAVQSSNGHHIEEDEQEVEEFYDQEQPTAEMTRPNYEDEQYADDDIEDDEDDEELGENWRQNRQPAYTG